MGYSDDDEIVGLYARGLNVTEVAAVCECSRHRIYRILHQNDVTLRATKMQRGPVDWGAVLEDYNGIELSVDQLCKKHGISDAGLYRFLARRPDVRRRRERRWRWSPSEAARKRDALGQAARKLPRRELDGAVADYEAGVAVTMIEAAHGITRNTLYRELARRGVKLRGRR